MTIRTHAAAAVDVIGRDLALRGCKTALNCLAGSGDAYQLFQADLGACKGHEGGLLCGGADVARPQQPALSHMLQRIGRGDPAPSIPEWSLRVIACTGSSSPLLRRSYHDGVDLLQAPAQARIIPARGGLEAKTQLVLHAEMRHGITAPVRLPGVPGLAGVGQGPREVMPRCRGSGTRNIVPASAREVRYAAPLYSVGTSGLTRSRSKAIRLLDCGVSASEHCRD
jgi:hypothetical protein